MHRIALATPAKTWQAAIVIGGASYLLLLAGGKSIPSPVRLLLWGLPIGMSLVAIANVADMERDSDEQVGMEALIRQQREHSIIREHQLTMANREIDYLGTLAELRNMVGLHVDAPSPGSDGQYGFDLGSPFALLEASMPLDQQIIESLGEPALALWHYLSQRAHQWCDKDGWIPIDRVRDNWGKRRNLDTEAVRSILSGLNTMGIGSWRDARLREWKLEISG
jgi:hypothetical protein